jgi:hypothetical protein
MTSHQNLVTVDLDSPAGRSDNAEAVATGLVEALSRTNTVATFFLPRSLAQSSGELAKRLSEAGHEVACLTTTEPAKARPYAKEFRDELTATRAAIEDATGIRVRGHRNATFAVDYQSEWAYDVLVEQGFEYDSSRVPPKYVEVGYLPIPRTTHAVRRWGGTLLEVPVSTADVLAMRVRLGATGSLRGMPLIVWKSLIESRQASGDPLVMHLRASEMRPQSLFGRGAAARADRRALDRMAGITGRFPFTSVAKALPDLLRSAPIIES